LSQLAPNIKLGYFEEFLRRKNSINSPVALPGVFARA
jgi:hypothetical protein